MNWNQRTKKPEQEEQPGVFKDVPMGKPLQEKMDVLKAEGREVIRLDYNWGAKTVTITCKQPNPQTDFQW